MRETVIEAKAWPQSDTMEGLLELSPMLTATYSVGAEHATFVAEYKEIIVALIAVIGVIWPYLGQRNKELNLKIAEQKRSAYAKFLTNFTEVAIAVMHDEEVTGKEADRERMLARDQLLLYASDPVIMAYNAWVTHSDEDGDVNEEGKLISNIFLAIRKDLLGASKVSADQLDALNPFERG